MSASASDPEPRASNGGLSSGVPLPELQKGNAAINTLGVTRSWEVNHRALWVCIGLFLAEDQLGEESAVVSQLWFERNEA